MNVEFEGIKDAGGSVVELFSGVGGLGIGFRSAGFRIEVGVDAHARRAYVYKLHVKPRSVLIGDVRAMDFSSWRNVDVIIAGPPCRPYSAATPKAKRGKAHPEFGLDLEIARAVEEIKPGAVIVEEVPNWDPKPLAMRLSDLGYSVDYRLIRFSDYGVPTTRSRWFIIALKRGSPQKVFKLLAELREDAPRPIDVIYDLPPDPCTSNRCVVSGRMVLNHINAEVRSKIRELLPKIPPGESLVSAHAKGLIEASAYVKDVSKKHWYWLYRVPLDKPMKVVPHPRRSIVLHPVYDRMITVRELARLMSFPDWFDFTPLGSKDEMYRAIADSVPPKFSNKLARALLQVLNPRG